MCLLPLWGSHYLSRHNKKGEWKMEKKYPEQIERIKSLIGVLSKEVPGPASGFSKLHKEALAEGALSSLPSLSVSPQDVRVAFRSTSMTLFDRAQRDREVLETISVAILMGGGPSMIYGAEAMDALGQCEAKGVQ